VVEPTYKVDGMHFDTLPQAKVVADRLWLRYDGLRSIMIYEVDHHGDEYVCETLEAETQPEEDNEQLDMF
jgi:hypothetical protein